MIVYRLFVYVYAPYHTFTRRLPYVCVRRLFVSLRYCSLRLHHVYTVWITPVYRYVYYTRVLHVAHVYPFTFTHTRAHGCVPRVGYVCYTPPYQLRAAVVAVRFGYLRVRLRYRCTFYVALHLLLITCVCWFPLRLPDCCYTFRLRLQLPFVGFPATFTLRLVTFLI